MWLAPSAAASDDDGDDNEVADSNNDDDSNDDVTKIWSFHIIYAGQRNIKKVNLPAYLFKT